VRPVGSDHVEAAVVVADGRGVDAVRGVGTLQRELRRAAETVADLTPVDEVTAVKNRNAGEVFEAAGHKKVITADSADAGVRIEAGYYRVVPRHRTSRKQVVGATLDHFSAAMPAENTRADFIDSGCHPLRDSSNSP